MTALLLVLFGCTPEPTPPAGDTLCDEASARFGRLACVHETPSWATWGVIQQASTAVDKIGETQWLAPSRSDARLDDTLLLAMPTVQWHWQLMAIGFPDRFPGMTHLQYSRLVLDPDLKEFYSGNLTAYDDGTFGFTLWSGTHPDLAPTAALIEGLWRELSGRVPMAPLSFVPNSSAQLHAMEDWGPVPFPIRDADDLLYEAYTPGVAFGTVHRYTLDELADAESDTAFGPTDVLVLDEAPFDLERPIAGAITGSRQGDLSHLNVRSAARGTPNCFLRDAHTTLSEWEGELVRIGCGESHLDIRAAELAEAEGWWEQFRPDPLDVPLPDLSDQPLMPLLALATDAPAERLDGVRAYGSKGANLAVLYQRIDRDLQIHGFFVPMVHFHDHLVAHGLVDEAARIASGPVLTADSAARREALVTLQGAIEEAAVDADLTAALAVQLFDTFGSTDVMVRFRSSSNAEDALGFSGAGLYDSTSVCAADSLDDDDVGPCHCDPDEPDERTIERGFGKVWSSVYGVSAWEERAWYGIDSADVAMGILVDTRAKDEQVNAVAFTGHPVLDDDRFLIDAQVGWLDVVSAEGGVVPEQILVDVDGTEVTLERVHASSEADEVLTDARATELALADIAAMFPIDGEAPDGEDLWLDTEWKVLEDGRLIVKQVRPFLRAPTPWPSRYLPHRRDRDVAVRAAVGLCRTSPRRARARAGRRRRAWGGPVPDGLRPVPRRRGQRGWADPCPARAGPPVDRRRARGCHGQRPGIHAAHPPHGQAGRRRAGLRARHLPRGVVPRRSLSARGRRTPRWGQSESPQRSCPRARCQPRGDRRGAHTPCRCRSTGDRVGCGRGPRTPPSERSRRRGSLDRDRFFSWPASYVPIAGCATRNPAQDLGQPVASDPRPGYPRASAHPFATHVFSCIVGLTLDDGANHAHP